MTITFDTPASVRRATASRPGWIARLATWRAHRAARAELLRCQEIDARFARDVGLTPAELVYTPL